MAQFQTGSCDDSNPCTQDECDPDTGCEYLLLSGGDCDDQDSSTVDDHCQLGVCLGLPDPDNDGIANQGYPEPCTGGQTAGCNDNCPLVPNANQVDENGDGVGEACVCSPDCADKECGNDGCGGSCGDCAVGAECDAGLCMCEFASCAGACCAQSEVCQDDECVKQIPGEDWLAVTDLFVGGIHLWKPDGSFQQLGSCGQPWGIEFIPPDRLYVACVASDSVEEIGLDGSKNTVYTTGDIFMNCRDVAAAPDGNLYFSTNVGKPSSVWRLDLQSGQATGYAKVGSQENMGIGFTADSTLFFGDIKGGGELWKQATNGGPSLVVSDFMPGSSLRDLEIGIEGSIHVVGTVPAGGYKVLSQAGDILEEHDLPGKGMSVTQSPTGTVYVGIFDTGHGIYRLEPQGSWTLLTDAIASPAGIQVVTGQ